MYKQFSTLILLCLVAMTVCKFENLKINADGSHWAVLVAGSNGFWNYRHQSDIFHAYHILQENGIPKENIIVMAYDDIANNSQNPFKGQVFNKPDPTGPGKNNYLGVTIDYSGSDVTPQNFLDVLEGKSDKLKGVGSGRVLGSTERDNVFVYFSDHGATGLVAFPSEELYADHLISTLKNLHAKKGYKELVFYLEACESGSMFNNILPAELNVYATTASNPDQSSWAQYCSPADNINGTQIGSCLGDEYSVNWMEDSDADAGLRKSLQSQFQNIFSSTKGSEVHQYGDLSYSSKDIGQYQGNRALSNKTPTVLQKIKKFFKMAYYKAKHLFNKYVMKSDSKCPWKERQEMLAKAKESKVDSRDVKLRYLLQKSEKMNDQVSQDEYLIESAHVKKSDNIFGMFDDHFNVSRDTSVTEIKFECLRSSVAAYKEICRHWGEYDLKFVKSMALACEKNVSITDVRSAFESICWF